MLEKALKAQPVINNTIILHSDQGSQYTFEEFIEYCSSVGVTQSMSKAGCSYDNAPMERYYNTLRNELIHLHRFHTDEELFTSLIYIYRKFCIRNISSYTSSFI